MDGHSEHTLAWCWMELRGNDRFSWGYTQTLNCGHTFKRILDDESETVHASDLALLIAHTAPRASRELNWHPATKRRQSKHAQWPRNTSIHSVWLLALQRKHQVFLWSMKDNKEQGEEVLKRGESSSWINKNSPGRLDGGVRDGLLS